MKIDIVRKDDEKTEETFLTIRVVDGDKEVHSLPFYYKPLDIRKDINMALKNAIEDLPGVLNMMYQLGCEGEKVEFNLHR